MTAAKQRRKLVAVYARTSVEDDKREKVSIPQQLEDAKALAQKNGWQVVGEYVDKDLTGKLPPAQLAKSARTKTRPALTRLIDDLQSGRVNTIIARKSDRIGRLETEQGLELYRLIDRLGGSFACTHENIPSISTPEGELQLTILIAFASFERKKIADNVKAAKEYQRRHGIKHNSCLLFGYRNGEKRGTVDVNQEQAPIVKEIFNRYANGASVYSITEWLIDSGVKTVTGAKWQRQTIARMLRNPLYIGKVALPDGKLIESKAYAPIIDESIFLACQQKQKANKGVKTGKRYVAHLVTGLLRCHCGERLVVLPERDRASGKLLYYYYLCQNKRHEDRPFVMREEEYDRWLENCIAPITIKQAVADNTAELIQLEKLERNLSDTRKLLAKGVLTAAEYEETTRELRQHIAELKVAVKTAAVVAKASTKTWKELNVLEKREHLASKLERMVAYRDGVLVVYKGIDVTINGKSHTIPASMFFPFITQRRDGCNHRYLCLCPDNIEDQGAWYEGEQTVNLKGFGEAKVAAWEGNGIRLAGYEPQTGHKLCPSCDTEKPLSDFWVDKRGKAHTYCRSCGQQYNAKMQAKREAKKAEASNG